MKTLLVLGAIGAVVAAGGMAAWGPLAKFVGGGEGPKWEFAEVKRGSIIATIESTGSVEPVQKVVIGSFVSGPIKEIFVDFNDEVKKGDLLAKVDPRLFEADVRRDKASLVSRKADVSRITALLKQARRDEGRALGLQQENTDYISQTEVDQYVFSVQSLEAQLEIAKASVEQAEAALATSKQNLEYTDVTAPIDGVIIDRKITPGETLASAFQTPELFIMAPDMRTKVHIFADVDEADIGRVIKAKEDKLPVQFTVDAWPGDVFEGEIEQIRVSSDPLQVVVTYPVVIAAANPDLKLLPDMTATVSFNVASREDVPLIPYKALQFTPPEREMVREEDRDILDGKGNEDEEDSNVDQQLSAAERVAARLRHKKRHVWVAERDLLKAVEIETGIDDYKRYEIVAGDLQAGDKVVVGVAEDE